MKILSIAKFVDQPLVINKLQKLMPTILTGGAIAYGTAKTLQQPHEKRKEALTKNAIVLGSTVAASIVAAHGLKIGKSKLLKGLMPPEDTQKLIYNQKKAIEKYLQSEKNISQNVLTILEKAKNQPLKISEITTVLDKTQKNENQQKLFSTLFGKQEDFSSKTIFAEMKRLPIYGASAIGGGLFGGLLADKLTNTDSKKATANKVKEAFYQYFANTFLCIVGSGSALLAAEKLNKVGVIKNLTPAKKMTAVISGILGMGVVFGSLAANIVGKKIINPIFCQNDKKECQNKIYSERKPELLDVCMHADDLATAGIYSGFKWIEPVLPLFYLIGGYRAGMGYRNNNACNVQDEKKINNCKKRIQNQNPHTNCQPQKASC